MSCTRARFSQIVSNILYVKNNRVKAGVVDMANINTNKPDIDGDIVMYTIKDIRKIFGCSESLAYSIVKAKGFPSIRIGGKIYVEKRALLGWLDKNRGSNIRL